jgi:hypothetical protein
VNKVCDLKLEGNIATLVVTYLLTVDIGIALIIYGAKMQKHPTGQLLGSEIYAAAIPNAVHKVLVFHAGQLTFRAEGDGNGTIQGRVGGEKTSCLAAVAMVNLKGPGAVEVQPVFSLKLGLGMFGTGDHNNRSFVF